MPCVNVTACNSSSTEVPGTSIVSTSSLPLSSVSFPDNSTSLPVFPPLLFDNSSSLFDNSSSLSDNFSSSFLDSSSPLFKNSSSLLENSPPLIENSSVLPEPATLPSLFSSSLSSLSSSSPLSVSSTFLSNSASTTTVFNVFDNSSVQASINDSYGGLNHRGTPITLDQVEVLFALSLSVLTVLCNLLVLFLTKFAGGGQSPCMVFVRSLCVADFFVGCYGLGKMVMFLFVDDLIINFFLPESLFFTASTAASLSLLILNVDRSLKISSPVWYAQHVDKSSIITVMVFLWNVSFVLGFLPLLGWNSVSQTPPHSRYVFRFFAFFPWHYLLVVGVLWLACVAGSVALLLYVRGKYDEEDITFSNDDNDEIRRVGRSRQHCLHYHLEEVRKYCQLRVTVVVDVVTWALCYLPYLAYLGLVCTVCPLGGRGDPNRTVYHFLLLFLLRSLLGSGVQLYRTVRVQGLASSSSLGLKRHGHSHHATASSLAASHRFHHRRSHHRQQQQQHHSHRKRSLVAAIAYSNPVWANSLTEFSELGDAAPHSQSQERSLHSSSSSSSEHGISNPAYRPSIQIDVLPLDQPACNAIEESTVL